MTATGFEALWMETRSLKRLATNHCAMAVLASQVAPPIQAHSEHQTRKNICGTRHEKAFEAPDTTKMVGAGQGGGSA